MSNAYEVWENLVKSYPKHPDQGLKLCKKKLQKDPSNQIHLVSHRLIIWDLLLIIPQLAQAHFCLALGKFEEALASCYAIKAPTSKLPLEPDIISTLQTIVAESQKALDIFTGVSGPHLSGLWKDALDHCPQAWLKEMRREMLTCALRLGYSDLAQQLFARLQRENPKKSSYHFAWVALCQIQAEKLPSDDRTAQSLKTLAYRSMKAAADNTLTHKPDTVRMIKKSNELRLLAQIYNKQNYDAELLAILDDPTIGIASDVAKHDSEFYLLKLRILQKSGQWEELNRFCVSSLDSLCISIEQNDPEKAGEAAQLVWADNWLVWWVSN